VKLPDGTAGARLTMHLDKTATPLPADTSLMIRPRSALGLKYVELDRGRSRKMLADGSTITASDKALAPELQEFFNIFDAKTRDNVQRNLIGYGNAFAYRGSDINRALESLPAFMASLPPVMSTLADPKTQLPRFFRMLERGARITAPIVQQMADGFAAGADTFAALSRDPQALKDTIAESPPTLEVGTRSLRVQRPLLASLVNVSGDLQGAAPSLRRYAPGITSALQAGVVPLRQSTALNARLNTSFAALRELGSDPGANMGVAQLNDTAATLNPSLRYLGPFITVCNYWNYSWTWLADHLTDVDQTGQIERIQSKSAGQAQHGMDSFGQAHPTNGLHIQQYGAAIDANGNADCETGQRGYPRHLASGYNNAAEIALDPTTPGNQGPTYKGRARVPAGETFSRLPEGSPAVRP
jgi:ABC-type transporter Mla subunit MlaD